MHAVKKGFDVTKYAHENGGIDYKEDFWKKDGYIVVNFEIVTFEAGFENIQGDGDTGMAGWRVLKFLTRKAKRQSHILPIQTGRTLIMATAACIRWKTSSCGGETGIRHSMLSGMEMY